ncbi:AraC family transcriptional regulator [Parabacteroides faecis]|uniref:helix-turn-helix transcriptional regulator n=1 Tax=Parabacteroides faecis TaxID=1217282 RepID=UPI0021644B72|nr:AraC family transcriptional regulator [Parabacteroides faecis]MCS2893316.1 AraC family transcriptional regulator [Parabacteroides faecis]UVQ48078.1 AraC family transcriptional regulator [Parabacteroides faecis]
MIHLNHTIDVLTGGTYSGNSSWNKKHSDIDNCFKLYQITDGELFLTDENGEFLLESGNLYFINGSKLVSQQCRKSFSTHWLHFIPKDIILHHSLLAMPLVVNFADTLEMVAGSLPHIEILISSAHTSGREYLLESLRMQTGIQAMIVSLLEQHSWTSPREIYSIHTIEPAISYIKEHFTEPIRLKQLADCCNISPNYFHKIFSKALQTTPANYISLLRMNAALPLLLNNEYNIKEIAYRLGFYDDAYFSRVFKNHYGITPGEYRKRRKELLF